MPAPPPKPKKGTPADLAEVERAMSVLKGRHPEHERTQREDQESRKRRARDLDSVARSESKRARSRQLKIVSAVVPIIVLFTFIGVFGRREMARRARIDAVSETFRPHGFTAIDTSLRGSTGAVEATAEPGCFLAVSTDTQPVSITRGGVTLATAAPALFCTCTAERIAASSPVGAAGGIALLRADAALIGGSRAFAYAPFKPASTLIVDEPCSEASLDTWIGAKRYPHPAASDEWLTAAAAPKRAALVAAGFHVVALGRGDLPFVIIEMPKESCLIATSASPEDRLGLRVKGGSTFDAEGPGTIGRCADKEATLIVSREGTGEVAVLVGPAKSIGGLLGLREVGASAGLPLSAGAVPAADRAWDAKQLLLGSAIPEVTITTAAAPDVPFEADARIVGLSFETASALSPDLAPEVHSACEPALDAKTREAICVFSGSQKWRTGSGGDAIGGLARSKYPFWLYTMQGAKDPGALAGLAKLVRLARALGRQGFQPTTLEALIEQPNGVEVLGRTGEDAVVAVGVGPTDPWVYPLTEDSEWSLDGPPQIALVKPLEKITLVTELKKLPPIQSRRTVVFRRQARP